MDVARFEDLQAEFLARVSQAVYCTMATVDRQNRPRSRVLHPIWEGPIGWVISWPASQGQAFGTQPSRLAGLHPG